MPLANPRKKGRAQDATHYGDMEGAATVKASGAAKKVAVDLQDERQLVGGSTDVFLGRLIG